MKVTRKRVIRLIIVIIILSILFYMFVTEWRFERIRVIGAKMYIVEEYQDYYCKVKEGSGTFIGTYFYKDIYFSFGQKKKMLEKTKEDVTNYLEKLIEEHNDIFYKYEISNDFKQVCIYETPGIIDKQKRRELGPEVNSRIGRLIGLYYNIKEGRSRGLGQIVTFVEPDD